MDKEELIGGGKAGGSLCCGGDEVMEFRYPERREQGKLHDHGLGLQESRLWPVWGPARKILMEDGL